MKGARKGAVNAGSSEDEAADGKAPAQQGETAPVDSMTEPEAGEAHPAAASFLAAADDSSKPNGQAQHPAGAELSETAGPSPATAASGSDEEAQPSSKQETKGQMLQRHKKVRDTRTLDLEHMA